jgi:hypothetical protein
MNLAACCVQTQTHIPNKLQMYEVTARGGWISRTCLVFVFACQGLVVCIGSAEEVSRLQSAVIATELLISIIFV